MRTEERELSPSGHRTAERRSRRGHRAISLREARRRARREEERAISPKAGRTKLAVGAFSAVEKTYDMALEEDLPDRPSHVERKPRSARALLKEAQTLAVQIETLLETPVHDADEACVFRMRLARAHTLGLLDQLEELVGPAFDRVRPGIHDCRASIPPGSGERARGAIRS